MIDPRRATGGQLVDNLAHGDVARLGQVFEELFVVAESDLDLLELLEVDARIRGRDLLVDNFRLLHPLVALRQRDLFAVALAVAELGEGRELILHGLGGRASCGWGR